MSLSSVWQFVKFLIRQRVIGFTVPDQPHFDPDSQLVFWRLMKLSKSYLEYGSGGSTLLANSLQVPTISVENDRYFAKAVEKKVAAGGGKNVMLLVDIGLTREWGKPIFHKATPLRLRRWRNYVEAPYSKIKEIQVSFPDLILVDGRFRRACALEGARQARLAGCDTTIFVDDYVDRDYQDIESYLGQPKMVGRAAIFRISSAIAEIPESAVVDALHYYQ